MSASPPPRPRIYALCDNERVAETLAVLLGPECDFRWIAPTDAAPEADSPLPRPALLLEARARRHQARAASAEYRWPGLRVLRVNLQVTLDPVAARRAIAAALAEANAALELVEVVNGMAALLAAEVKPRLVAARCLLALTRNHRAESRRPWAALLSEQFAAISEYVDRLAAASER
ncbi:MAG: hypothetical protein HY699_08770 [Deltaproteobacteria bacterium]|nr:hypothetical protein [Deltaproteobacteria bacterium]